MGNKKKYCLVISNDKFKNGDNLPGHRVDVPRLKDVFKDLLFEVKVYENKKAGEIDKIFKDLSENKDLLDGLSILVCVILSHGDNGVFVGVDNEEIKLNNIFAYFEGPKCEALINIPKVFFINTCRGTGEDKGTGVILSKANFLKGFFTADGNNSLTDDKRGSLYIQELCNELQRSAQSKDLVSILTDVSNEVVMKYQLRINDPVNTGANHDSFVVQMPIFKSTLLKDLYLVYIYANQYANQYANMQINMPICESTTNFE